MLNYLVVLPVVLLALAALGIVVLQQVRPSIGYTWLIGAVAGLAATGVIVFLHWRLPLQIAVEWWRPFSSYSIPPTFRLDESSWPYAFSLAVLALAFMMTDAARLETEARPYNWAVGLVLAGLGILAVMAGNPLTLVEIWTAVDVVELLMLLTSPASRRMGAQTVTVFGVRVAGTLLVIIAILFARSQQLPFDLSPIPSSLAILMLLAAGLRLGVLPLNIPYTQEVYAWRGLGNVMRMLGPASSLMVLGRMPALAVPVPWKGLFLFFSALAALYGAVMWMASDNEINGRPYWFTSLAALAVASVANDQPQASIAWGMVLILSGSVMFYYSARRKQILYIPILGLISTVGLPFTPAAVGWKGVVGASSGFFTFLFLLAVLFLIWGYVRHILRPREELYRMERWVHTVYPGGLLFLVLAQWAIMALGGRGALTAGVWWASAGVALVAALGVVLYYSRRGLWVIPRSGAPLQETLPPAPVDTEMTGELPAELAAESTGGLNAVAMEAAASPTSAVSVLAQNEYAAATQRWVSLFSRQIGHGLSAFFRLAWLYAFIAWMYRVLQNIIQLLTAMLEGDGGILWSLVLLALLISIIWLGGKP